ncbi:hypothetical protein [Candidatus Villigracilis saccharophilus]|uniref:hypothetical protein n=1 Tax=Candidatus Villigracilis saccharophilus TaxID=3140684 RepID=UPI003136C901|nr:hypothetical protein [Anaerolineales bacterium]
MIAFLQFQAITVHENSLPFFFIRALFIVWILFGFMLIASAYKDLVVWRKWKNILDRPLTKDILLTAAASLLFLRICLWVFKELLTEPLSQTIGGYIGLLTPALDLMGYVSFEIVFLVFFVNLSGNLEYKGRAGKFIFTALVVFFLCGGALQLFLRPGWELSQAIRETGSADSLPLHCLNGRSCWFVFFAWQYFWPSRNGN